MIIAIDGQSSCGKSTLARDLSEALDMLYIDSGAMYRAITFYLLSNNIDYTKDHELLKALDDIHLAFKSDTGHQRIHLNDIDVEDQIRTLQVSSHVSEVSAIPAVREFLIDKQRQFGNDHAVVMDGRDIATVIFPDADVKFFLTANKDMRVERRHKELLNKGIESTVTAVRENIDHRDRIDSTRAASPLKMADDAILIDNTHLTRRDQLELALTLIRINVK